MQVVNGADLDVVIRFTSNTTASAPNATLQQFLAAVADGGLTEVTLLLSIEFLPVTQQQHHFVTGMNTLSLASTAPFTSTALLASTAHSIDKMKYAHKCCTIVSLWHTMCTHVAITYSAARLIRCRCNTISDLALTSSWKLCALQDLHAAVTAALQPDQEGGGGSTIPNTSLQALTNATVVIVPNSVTQLPTVAVQVSPIIYQVNSIPVLCTTCLYVSIGKQHAAGASENVSSNSKISQHYPVVFVRLLSWHPVTCLVCR